MRIFAILIIFFTLYTNAFADYIVKKSKSNICHAPGTTYYDRTYYYTAYRSLEDCLKSGGRLPRR
jgi:hypothetical protein